LLNILQNNAATRLRRGGSFNNGFITNLRLSQRVSIFELMGHSILAYFSLSARIFAPPYTFGALFNLYIPFTWSVWSRLFS